MFIRRRFRGCHVRRLRRQRGRDRTDCSSRQRAAGVGRTVLEAVRATRDAVGTNTNLGTLAADRSAGRRAARSQRLADGIGDVLLAIRRSTTRGSSTKRFASPPLAAWAARARPMSSPTSPPDLTLVDAMRLAADRDLVARQYTNGFADVLHGTAAWIADGLARGWPLSAAIVLAHIRQMANATRQLDHLANAARKLRLSRVAVRSACSIPANLARMRMSALERISTPGCGPTAIAAIRARRPT